MAQRWNLLWPFRTSKPCAGAPPRLQELLCQLDADGHDTSAFRRELRELLDAAGIRRAIEE
jgi:hypothetical protein